MAGRNSTGLPLSVDEENSYEGDLMTNELEELSKKLHELGYECRVASLAKKRGDFKSVETIMLKVEGELYKIVNPEKSK